MTRVLHTADVHLREDTPERLAALDAFLERAATEDVDVVTIGGDLFDRPENVDQLRPALRNDLFADRDFEILLVPGNHDVEAFRGDVFFGESCTVFTEDPFDHWTSPDGDLRITGLPYRDRPEDDLLLALQDREPFDGAEALLLHCSLDAPFEDQETGAEEGRRYFPVTEELLAELGFDFYLAGHFHGAHEVSLSNGGTFVYPGTPASTTTAETGRRRVAVLDTNSGIDFEPLSTYHHARLELTATPGDESAILERVREWADRQAIDCAEAAVRVDGYVEMDEEAFNEALVAAADPATVNDQTRSVDHVRSHPLFQDFETELASMDWDEETEAAVTERTLEVFSRLAAGGDL